MGFFSNKVKKLFNPQTGVTSEDLKGRHDMYFVRLSNQPDYYIHHIGAKKDDKEKVEYRPVKSVKGAAVFQWKQAWNFIRESGMDNLEMVEVNSVLETENQNDAS